MSTHCRPSDHVVVQIDVADEHLAEVPVVERGVDGLADGRVNREAVVVRCDLHLAGGQVLDGLVDAAMAELELVGAEAECAAEQLIAEADAEERVAGVQDLRAAARPRGRPAPGRRGRWRRTRRPGSAR